MTLRFIITALLAATLSRPLAAQQSRRFEFRNLHLRDTLPNDVATKQQLGCSASGDHVTGLEDCGSLRDDSIAGAPVVYGVYLVDRKVAHFDFMFSPEAFTRVLTAFRTQWGPPSSLTSNDVQTRAGGKFQNTVAKWRFADGTFELTRYAGTLDASSAVISDDRLSAIARRRRECARARAMKKDFGGSPSTVDCSRP